MPMALDGLPSKELGVEMSSAVSKARKLFEARLTSLSQDLARARSATERLPSEEDYHFYKLFPEFKRPIDAAAERIKKLLLQFGSVEEWSDEPDEASDWLVGIVDDLLEQVDKSLHAAEKGDLLATSVAAGLKSTVGASVASHVVGKGPVQFHMSTIRKPQELFAVAVDNSNSPFQAKGPYLSYDGEEDNAVGFNAEDWGAINSRIDGGGAVRDTPDNGPAAGEAGIERMHQGIRDGGENAPTLVRSDGPVKRPELSVETDLLGRSSRPASPSSLARGASPRPASPSRGILALDMHAKRLGSAKRGRVHPLERTLRELSYPAWQFRPPPDPLLEPEPIDARQIEIVDTLPGLRIVAQKLAVEREIACDLEAHHYRSFQGFVCLMQLSTRKEDFVVDTIALRDHIGPMLGPIFADSSILKVLHGADRDVLWLQRDFGIYVVNMFDTGQAARQLSLASFGLGYLLEHFCGVHTDKRYQLADWRLRPLPEEMFKYARMDTHFLLYIYDRVRGLLLSKGSKSRGKRKVGGGGESSDDQEGLRKDLVQQVLDRSRDLCLQLYEKELFRETSYLKLYKKHDRQMNKPQLAALAGLYAWRDRIAREQDESCGYILPKHLLLRLAEELPLDVRKLQSIVRGQSPVVTQRAADVIEVVRAAKEQASGAGGAAFDSVVWEGADVIPDFGTSEDEGSSEAWEAAAREGFESDGDAESGLGLGGPESPKGGFEGLGAGVPRKVIGQSSLGDPRKSAVGPSLGSTADAGSEQGGDEGLESAPVLPRGTPEAKVQRGVVVKRAAGSSLFGRPAKKAHTVEGSEKKAVAAQGSSEKSADEAGRGLAIREVEAAAPPVEAEALASISSISPESTERAGPSLSGAGSGGPERSVGVSQRGANQNSAEVAANVSRPLQATEASSSHQGKEVVPETGPGQRKRKGGLRSMFGTRAGGSGDRSAKEAAERIRASLALPFEPVGRVLHGGEGRGIEEAGEGSLLGLSGVGAQQTGAETLNNGAGVNADSSVLGQADGGAAPLDDVMMLDEGQEDEEALGNEPQEEETGRDPQAEKLALFGTQDLPKPISQAYRGRGGLGEAQNGRSDASQGVDGGGKKRKVLDADSEASKERERSEGAAVRKEAEKGRTKDTGTGFLSGRRASALQLGCEGLSKEGKFDFAAAAGALGLGSFLGPRVASGKKEGGKGAKPAKQNRGAKPEEESYGVQKEEPGQNFDPFASMEEEGTGIKAGKRSQAFPRSGNRMSTFRRN